MLILSLFALPLFASADDGGDLSEFSRLDEALSRLGMNLLLISTALITIIVIRSMRNPFPSERFKLWSFIGIVAPVAITTGYMAISTIYINVISSSGGPVHWHADFGIYHCGNSVDLEDPTGLSNRIGTPVLHEHGDDRIHVEGVVLDSHHVNLSEFFRVIGGYMTTEEIKIPTDEGTLAVQNGNLCPDNKAGTWQVFVYQTNPETKEIRQYKLPDFPNYQLSPFGVVPPADCIIFEFSSETKDKTDKICNFYQIEINKGTYKYIQN